MVLIVVYIKSFADCDHLVGWLSSMAVTHNGKLPSISHEQRPYFPHESFVASA